MDLKNKQVDILYLCEKDPKFNIQSFESYTQDVFKKLQTAWTEDSDKGTWNNDIRQYLTDDLFNLYSKQLKRLEKSNQRNVIKNISCKSKVICYKEIENYDFIAVSIKGSLIDYIENKSTKKLVMGSKDEYIDFLYTYIFIRPIYSRDKEKTMSLNCAYCGATLNPSNGNRCDYCNGINITTASPKWILCRIERNIPYYLMNIIPYEDNEKETDDMVIEIDEYEEIDEENRGNYYEFKEGDYDE